MKWIRIAILVAVFLPAYTYAQDEGQSVVAAFYEALGEEDYERAATLVHPDAIEAVIEGLKEPPSGEEAEDLLAASSYIVIAFLVQTRTGLELEQAVAERQPVELYALLLEAGVTGNHINAAARVGVDVIGAVEADSMVHVMLEVQTASLQAGQAPAVVVTSAKRHGVEWRILPQQAAYQRIGY